MILLLTLFLTSVHAAHAMPIVLNTEVFSEVVDCEIDLQRCQKIELLKITTRTYYHEALPTVGPEYHERIPYKAIPNPCLDDTIPLKEKPWCIPPHYEPTMGGQGPTMYGNIREWVEDSVLFRQQITDIDCPQIPTPEPASILYGLCGIAFILAGRKLKERSGLHGE